MRKDYPSLKNTEVQSYISNLGHHILQSSSLSGTSKNYEFIVVNSPTMNAFSLPSGRVYISAPLIQYTQSESELAGIIGHELGHIAKQHTLKRIYKIDEAKRNSWLYGTGGTLLGGLSGMALATLICPTSSNCTQYITALGAVSGFQGALLVQKYSFFANAQREELEADRLGFQFTTQAGFDPKKISHFHKRLLKATSKAQKNMGLFDMLTTHPPSTQRVEQLEKMVLLTKQPSLLLDSEKYKAIKTKLRTIS